MVKNYLGINIDYSRDSIIPEQGYAMLTKKGFYKKDNEKSPQESFARAATCFSYGDLEFGSEGFMMPYLNNGLHLHLQCYLMQ